MMTPARGRSGLRATLSGAVRGFSPRGPRSPTTERRDPLKLTARPWAAGGAGHDCPTPVCASGQQATPEEIPREGRDDFCPPLPSRDRIGSLSRPRASFDRRRFPAGPGGEAIRVQRERVPRDQVGVGEEPSWAWQVPLITFLSVLIPTERSGHALPLHPDSFPTRSRVKPPPIK